MSTAVQSASAEQRREALARQVANHARLGYRVESQDDHQTILVKPGGKVNHILHLLLSLVTLGLWLPVWFVLAAVKRREKVLVVTVDEQGRTASR